MFCSNCGKEVENTWTVCPYCKVKLKSESVEDSEIEKQNDSNMQINAVQSNIPKRKHSKKKTIFCVVLIIFVIIPLILGAFFRNQVEEVGLIDSNEFHGEESIELSEMDMETVVNQSQKEIEKLGFEKSKDEFMWKNGEIAIDFDEEGKIYMIVIEGDKEKAPSFHKVKLGMGAEEAKELLIDSYPIVEGDDRQVYASKEFNENVVIEYVDNEVSSITYMKLSEEERKAVLDELYIFPNSDSAYLTEEEVRALDIEKLRIAKNEIFARHGYIFKDETLKSYFETKPWYEGKIQSDNFKTSVFNEFENKNLELIKGVYDEISGEADRKKVIDDAYNFLVGRKLHLIDTETDMDFISKEQFIEHGYQDVYTNYSLSAKYEFDHDVYQWLLFMNIEGEEYYFRYFEDGTICLDGYGAWAGWYEPSYY